MKTSPFRPLAWRIVLALVVLASASAANAQATQNANGQPPPERPFEQYEVSGASEATELGVDLSVFLASDQKAEDFVKLAGSLSKVTLYLNGYQMTDIPVRYGPALNQFIFRLERTGNPDTQKAWSALLGGLQESPGKQTWENAPKPYGRITPVSVGFGGRAVKSAIETRLHPMHRVTALLFFIGLILVLGLLTYLARNSNLIRDIGPDLVDSNGKPTYQDKQGKPVTREVTTGGKIIYKDESGKPISKFKVKAVLKSYSLARTQLAFWVVITLVSFFFIWLVTTDLQTLPTFALGILGISSATAVASTFIDASQRTGSESEREALASQLTQLQAAAKTETDPTKLADLNQQIANTQAAINNFKPEPSRGFWKDILSDNTGITIHRFQIVVWTIALGIIFSVTVINTLIMPNFDSTLLALMGISSAAYISLKPTENKADN